MKCRTIQKKLSAYMDEEVDRDQKAMIEAHLQHCATCQQVLSELIETWDLLSLLPKPESVPYFFIRLNTKLTSERTKEKTKWLDRVIIPATAIAVIILGIVTGNIVGKNGELLAEQSTEDEIISSLYLDSFNDFPSTSLGKVYFDLVSQE